MSCSCRKFPFYSFSVGIRSSHEQLRENRSFLLIFLRRSSVSITSTS
jgi:hypothetical protein